MLILPQFGPFFKYLALLHRLMNHPLRGLFLVPGNSTYRHGGMDLEP